MSYVLRQSIPILMMLPVLALMFAGAVSPAVLCADDSDPAAGLIAMEQTFVRIIEDVENSVVAIARFKLPLRQEPRIRLNPFRADDRPSRSGDPGFDMVPNQFGAGIVIAGGPRKNERFILTNYHVVKGGPIAGQEDVAGTDRLYVRFADRRGFDASIVAADPRSDLAVLKVDLSVLEATAADIQPMRLGLGDGLKKGQLVLALGNPYAIARDGSASVSWGMISNISRATSHADTAASKTETIHSFGTLLQIDTRLNLGTSGGALVNLQGELVGITTSLAALDGYEKSAGYAIPMTAATRRIIESLVNGYEVEYGFLGVTPEDVSPDQLLKDYSGKFTQYSAATVKVMRNAPAEAAGMADNDLVLAVNGKPVYGRNDLMREIGLLGAGATAHVRGWRERGRRELNLYVNLGKWPVLDDEGIVATNDRHPVWRGVKVDFPTGRAKFMLPDLSYPRSVVVTHVEPDSRADTAELSVGDFITHVNNIPVETPADFYKATKELQDDVRLQLLNDRHVVLRK